MIKLLQKNSILVLLGALISLLVISTVTQALNTDNDSYIKSVITSNDFVLELSNKEKTWLKNSPPIRLGIDRAFPPFGSITKEHEYIGFSSDIMRIIEYRLGIQFDIKKDAPWNETMKMAKAEEIDMISALVNSKQRQEFLHFTPSYIKNPTIIINDGMTHGYIGSLKNLNGKKVAIERGSYSAGVLGLEYPDIKLVPVENTSLALSLVSIGKADAYVGNGVTASYLIRKLGYHNLSYSGQTEYSSSHSIGVIKSNKMLSNIMDKALASISKNDIETIANYWFGLNTQPFINKNTALLVSSSLIGLLLFFVIWAFRLRKSKNKLKDNQDIMKAQSEIDHLTGLGNRRKFYKILNKQIDLANEKDIPFALFYLDLDMFKEVNDRLGHATGDLLLIQASERIIACFNDDVSVSRIGGDEFMIIFPSISNIEEIDNASILIRKTLSDVFLINDNEIYISTSIGITRYPDDADNAEQLVNNGDQAMYHSKRKGRNCHSYFNKEMQKEALYKASLIKDLHVALEKQQFKLHYQPIINLADNSINKAEALIRWNHPERGLVSPAEFIPLAEEGGIINELGDWTFKEAIDYTAELTKEYDENFQMTVNTSPLQYRQNGINVPSLFDYLKSRGLMGKNIAVEITEGVLMETSKSSTNNLFQLRDLDINVAIDDFGTGYSSLSYLNKFDIDYLKIDQSFVLNLTADSNDLALVQAIIVMAHQLSIKVIAEGIETKAQHDILIKAGCDYGQGFYFSKPIPSDKFTKFVKQWNKKKELL